MQSLHLLVALALAFPNPAPQTESGLTDLLLPLPESLRMAAQCDDQLVQAIQVLEDLEDIYSLHRRVDLNPAQIQAADARIAALAREFEEVVGFEFTSSDGLRLNPLLYNTAYLHPRNFIGWSPIGLYMGCQVPESPCLAGHFEAPLLTFWLYAPPLDTSAYGKAVALEYIRGLIALLRIDLGSLRRWKTRAEHGQLPWTWSQGYFRLGSPCHDFLPAPSHYGLNVLAGIAMLEESVDLLVEMDMRLQKMITLALTASGPGQTPEQLQLLDADFQALKTGIEVLVDKGHAMYLELLTGSFGDLCVTTTAFSHVCIKFPQVDLATLFLDSLSIDSAASAAEALTYMTNYGVKSTQHKVDAALTLVLSNLALLRSL